MLEEILINQWFVIYFNPGSFNVTFPFSDLLPFKTDGASDGGGVCLAAASLTGALYFSSVSDCTLPEASQQGEHPTFPG